MFNSIVEKEKKNLFKCPTCAEMSAYSQITKISQHSSVDHCTKDATYTRCYFELQQSLMCYSDDQYPSKHHQAISRNINHGHYFYWGIFLWLNGAA